MFKLNSRAFILIIIFSLVGHAQTQAQIYTIGVENIKYLPYYDHENNEEYIGFARDILDMFAKHGGYSFVYEVLPLNRLRNDFLDKKIDFKFPDNPYWKSERRVGVNINYSEPVVGFIDGLMVLPENKGKSESALKNIGVVAGFTPWSYFDLIESGKISVTENESVTGILKQVINNRIDGSYLNVSVAKYQLSETLKLDHALVFDPDLPHTKSSYYFSSIKHPGVIKEFNRFLVSQKVEIDKLKKKYEIDIIE